MAPNAANKENHGSDPEEGPEQDFTLSERDFERVIGRIYQLAGIVIEPQKRQMIHARLSRRLRATGMANFTAYLDHATSGADPEEMQEFINAITTNLTSFFRENHHFTHFRANVVDPAIASNSGKLRIWSAGCSTGEEPYSIALTLLQAASSVPSDFKILATDLDTKVLEKASTGLYLKEKAGEALIPHKAHAKPASDGEHIEIGKAARALISFRQLNLMQAWPMKGPFDAIFCRNVLIYFDAETKANLINRYAEIIRPGGFLYLGHSESILGDHAAFSNEGQTTYKRRS